MRIFRYLIMVLAIAALATPAAARAADGSIFVFDDVEHGQGFRDAANSDYTDNTVSISPGDRVTFIYPVVAGSNAGGHNVGFVPGGATPASCTQTAGTAILAAPPLPTVPDGTWLERVLHVHPSGHVRLLLHRARGHDRQGRGRGRAGQSAADGHHVPHAHGKRRDRHQRVVHRDGV